MSHGVLPCMYYVCTDLRQVRLNCSPGGLLVPLDPGALHEDHFRIVVGVGADLELARLRVQGKRVESHRADERDVGGLNKERKVKR